MGDDNVAAEIAAQKVRNEFLGAKLDEILRRLDTLETRIGERIDNEAAELRVVIADQEKRIRALEQQRWIALGAGGIGAASGIGGALMKLLGG